MGSITSERLLFRQSSSNALRNVYWKKYTCNEYDIAREKSVDLKHYFWWTKSISCLKQGHLLNQISAWTIPATLKPFYAASHKIP